MLSEYRCGRGGRFSTPVNLSKYTAVAAVARLGEMHCGIPSCLTASHMGNPWAGFCEFRIATAECEKTGAAHSVVAVALALAVTGEEITFGNREPTVAETNLISAKVDQSGSFFWLALFSLSPLFAGPNNNKKTINRRLSEGAVFSLLPLAGFHRRCVSFVSKQADKSAELCRLMST